MSNIPSDLKYAKSHEWVRVSGGTATVGITDHAQAELTDVVFVELPEAGRQVKAGEACAVVESVKTASDIYSPVEQTRHRQSRFGEHRALRGRLVFQNQIEQSR
jgi:glycine cleavage system H protein